MSDPSTGVARLRVTGSSCRLAGLLPAPKGHSDRPGFGHLDRCCHACRLTDDGAHVLLGAAKVNASLRNVRVSWLLLPSLRARCSSNRPEALEHADSEDQPSAVHSAAVWLLVSAHLDECRVPGPTASIRPCSWHSAGYSGWVDGLGGREALGFGAWYTVWSRPWAAWRRCGALSAGRSNRGSTSNPWLPRPMAAASVYQLHVMLVSCPRAAVCVHSERCRADPHRTFHNRSEFPLHIELPSPPQSYGVL